MFQIGRYSSGRRPPWPVVRMLLCDDPAVTGVVVTLLFAVQTLIEVAAKRLAFLAGTITSILAAGPGWHYDGDGTARSWVATVVAGSPPGASVTG